jgi:hypothetical protein
MKMKTQNKGLLLGLVIAFVGGLALNARAADSFS